MTTDDEDFAGVSGFEECIAFAEGNFGLINFDDAFQWFAIRIDHRAPQLLCQQPGGFVGHAKLISQLQRRHAVGMRRHQMRSQNHVVSGNLERCITVPAVTEVWRPQSRHSCKRGRLFSAAARRLPQAGQTKPSGHRRLNMKAAQLASSENAF